MTIIGISLDEVKKFIAEIDKTREKIHRDESYRIDIQNHGKNYENIKKYLLTFSSYLCYTEEARCMSFYRVRKSQGEEPYKTKKDLKYPDPDIKHEDRMNNTSFRVLYTSLHEFTAMAESRIDDSFLGKSFQLTRFFREKPLKIYRLGLFSELYLNTPRDSEFFKKNAATLLGIGNHEKTIQGYSALEVTMANILYDQEKDYHILSSILADALFSSGTNIEAIMYPSMQNRYGVNVAFNKESADALEIGYSAMNKIVEVHKNGFFKYKTQMECTDFSNPENLIYTPIDQHIAWR
ncbi:RES family NAD+ phosphorylase [Burkholderia anthina]|uniref:RES family NAD+ phosphorylase n=1 Tax=Burkholderia anthina TaxID=179879 RepID=UPI00158B141C|nr:RES family NAD+ phosphorylase [Burkholderia anthina]